MAVTPLLLTSCFNRKERTHDKEDWDKAFNNYGIFKDNNFWLYSSITFKYNSKDQQVERKMYVDNNKLKMWATEFGLDNWCYMYVDYNNHNVEDDTYLVDFYQEGDKGWTKTTSYRSLDFYYIYSEFIPTNYEDFEYNKEAEEFSLKHELDLEIAGDIIKVKKGRVVFEEHRLTEYALEVDVTSSGLMLHKTIKCYPCDYGGSAVHLPEVK